MPTSKLHNNKSEQKVMEAIEETCSKIKKSLCSYDVNTITNSNILL